MTCCHDPLSSPVLLVPSGQVVLRWRYLNVVVAVAVLSAGVKSVGVTVAVSEMVPFVVRETTMVMMALRPAPRLPTLQVTVPPFVLEAVAGDSVHVP
jgi:hypothetical protein